MHSHLLIRWSVIRWILIRWLLIVIFAALSACNASEGRQAQYYKRAQHLFNEGNVAGARIDVNNVLQINSTHPQARFLLALLFERERNWQPMYANLKLAIHFDPQHLQARIKLAQMLFANKKFDEVLEQVEAVLAVSANHPDANVLMGSVFFRKGQSDAAIRQAQLALKEQPGHVGAVTLLIALGKQYAASGDLSQADRVYREISRKEFSAVDSSMGRAKRVELALLVGQLGVHHQKAGRVNDAYTAYKKAIELDPQNPSAFCRLAALHISKGQWQQAVQIYTQAIAANPNEHRLKLLLARVHSQTGDYPRARKVYESLLAQRPQLQQAVNNLAVILVDHMPSEENLKSALRLAQSLRNSRHPAFLDTLGWVNLKLGNSYRALSLLETSLALGGSGPQYHYHLGMAYYLENQPLKARYHLELAVTDNDIPYMGRDEALFTLNTIETTTPKG
jgi:tetratricopeptide (TPR) repeat protein